MSEPGDVLVSGRLLTEIAKALPARPVELSDNGDRLEIVCGQSRFALPLMAVDDYPALPALPPMAGAVDYADFCDAVTRVAVAAGRAQSHRRRRRCRGLARPCGRKAEPGGGDISPQQAPDHGRGHRRITTDHRRYATMRRCPATPRYEPPTATSTTRCREEAGRHEPTSAARRFASTPPSPIPPRPGEAPSRRRSTGAAVRTAGADLRRQQPHSPGDVGLHAHPRALGGIVQREPVVLAHRHHNVPARHTTNARPAEDVGRQPSPQATAFHTRTISGRSAACSAGTPRRRPAPPPRCGLP
ncbi:hypothetical protein ACIRRA_43290 [Nocardia sp. NPDC101769]|uniref:hypothetical protein n=1 Tax=Nocardia sp. NPDC101769 TaxID=3364333 RepID=UPI00380E6D69